MIARSLRIGFVLLVFSPLVIRADDRLAGRWQGAIEIPGSTQPAVIDLAQDNGAWHGSIILPGLDIAGVPLTEIAPKSDGLSFALKSVLADDKRGPAKFSGQLSENGELRGEFEQAGNRAPFLLRKTGPAQVAIAPRSTQVAKDVEGEWKGEYELLGYPRKVSLKLQNRAAEGAGAEFVIVGRKVNNLPVDLVTQEGNFLMVESHETGLSFEGRVESQGIEGVVLQGSLEIPVTLHREN